MISFKIILDAEKAKTFQNRKVEYAFESRRSHNIFGKIVSWQGALENEYFAITFVGGNLIISVCEREYHLGKINEEYAISTTLDDATNAMEDETADVTLEQVAYNQTVAPIEAEEIRFEDALAVLK